MENIHLLFAGDFCVRYGSLKHLQPEKMAEIAAPIRALTTQYDASVINVETVFTDNCNPVKKSGPCLHSPKVSLQLLQNMGFTIGAMANNHVCDQGYDIGLRSKELVRSIGMQTMGYGKNLQEANAPVRVTVKGKRISFFNFAEHEFEAATDTTPGFAPLHAYRCGQLVKEEKKTADYVFVMLHAGSEYCPFPRRGVRDLSYHLIDSGADGVIIAHPHCPTGIETYQEKPIAYSLGNFYMCKNSQKVSLWNFGYMADICISADDAISLTPIPYEFGAEGEYLRLLSGNRKQQYLTYLQQLSDLVTKTPDTQYQRLLEAWALIYWEEYEEYYKLFLSNMSPDGELFLLVKNLFTCESHVEAMQNYLQLFTKNRTHLYEEEKALILQLQGFIV